MAHNSLRRAISSLKSVGGAITDPFDADMLLDRALAALGGPVADTRPQVETIPTAPVDIIIGRDLGDETAHIPTEDEKADIGRPADVGEYAAQAWTLPEDTHVG